MTRPEAALSFEELDALGDAELVAESIQRVLEREGAVGYTALSSAERTIYLAVILEFEVENRGFDQYFYNSSGDRACETIAALEALEQPGYLEVHRKALALFPESRPSQNSATRARQVRALPGGDVALDAVTCDFYRLSGFDESAIARYIRAHRAELPLHCP